MMNYKITLFLCAGLFAFAACSDDDNGSAEVPSSPTRLVVYMHDQPAQYQQVNIDLQSVEFKGSGGDNMVLDGNYAGIYNLLDLQNGLDTLIADTVVNYGALTQIRLILGPNNTVMVDNVLHPLQTPSAEQSGLKINVQSALSGLDSLVLNIDFDAHESVVETGNGGYILKPVLTLE